MIYVLLFFTIIFVKAIFESTTFNTPYEESNKKQKRTGLVSLIVAASLLGGAAVGGIVHHDKKNKDNENQSDGKKGYFARLLERTKYGPEVKDYSDQMVKDEDGNMTLKITDPKTFWSLSRYLVIEVG